MFRFTIRDVLWLMVVLARFPVGVHPASLVLFIDNGAFAQTVLPRPEPTGGTPTVREGAPWVAPVYPRSDANGIKIVSVCHVPVINRYLLVYNPRDNAGHFALFEAAEPWGPWKRVAYLRSQPVFMPPEPNNRVSLFHVAPKWWSADGREFTLIFNTGDDRWNTIRGRLLFP